MDSLGHLLTHGGGGERRTLQAAHAVAVVDEAVRAITGLSARDARTVSLNTDTATIRVQHPAVAAMIYRDAPRILESVNDKLRRHGSRQRIRRLSTRVS